VSQVLSWSAFCILPVKRSEIWAFVSNHWLLLMLCRSSHP
jgi:hypothetical protein